MKRNALSLWKRYKLYGKAAVIIIAVVFAVSCQSVPERAEMESSVELLPEGSDIIIRADIETNRELIEPVLAALSAGMPEKLSTEFLERTTTVWAGLDFDSAASPEDGSPVFRSSIAAEGDYPKGLVDLGLWWDSGWKKDRHVPAEGNASGLPYWYEKDGNNQLAMPSSGYLLASSGKIGEMLDSWTTRRGVGISREWFESEQRSDLSIMIRNLSPEDYAAFVPGFERLPVESMMVSLRRNGDDYLISGRFHMENPVSAFLFTTIFRTLVVAAKDQDGKRLFPNLKEIVIKNEEDDVVLDGMRISMPDVLIIESKWLGTAGLYTEE